MAKEVIIIGYSGHALVVCDIFRAMKVAISGYCEKAPKKENPLNLKYLGNEKDAKTLIFLKKKECFVAIGDNAARRNIFEFLKKNKCRIANAIHPSAVLSPLVSIGSGVMISPNVSINTKAILSDGVICNTACVVEHECHLGKFTHVGPGAVLCGNVKTGSNTLIGANAVIKPNITIGSNVVIGAGTVVIRDVGDNKTIAGNPSHVLIPPSTRIT